MGGWDPSAVVYGLFGAGVGLYAGSLLANLVHEMGHALTILALTDRKATVRIGRGKARIKFRLGRLSVYWDPIGAWGKDDADKAQVAFVGGGLSRGRQVAIFASGPLAALVLTGVTAAGALIVGSEQPFLFGVLAVTALFGLESGLVNLLPFRIGGQKTDGRKIVDALGRAPSDEIVRQQLWLYLNSGIDRIDRLAREASMSREAWLAERFNESVIPDLHEMARTAELGERDFQPPEDFTYEPQPELYAVKIGSNSRADEDRWQYRLSIVLKMAHSDVLLMGSAAKQAGLAPADWIRLEFGRRVVEPVLGSTAASH